jgi:hypothetical protein
MVSLTLIELGVLIALLGLFFLIRRVVEAAKHRANTGSVAVAGALGGKQPGHEASPATFSNKLITPTYVSDRAERLEVQLDEADEALFLVLMECCNAIVEAHGRGSDPRGNAFLYVRNLKESGQSSMTNKEIADHAYQLAAELRTLDSPVMTDVRRILAHLTHAEHLHDS